MTTIPEHTMRGLLDDGAATPLLPDTFPVPARYAGRWWHQPVDTDDDAYVPASPELAARYADLHQRRRHAHEAGAADISRSDPPRGGPP